MNTALIGEEKSVLERLLISHCAPNLAGIKTGNLFNYCFKSKGSLLTAVRNENQRLNEKGVYLEILRIQKSSDVYLKLFTGGRSILQLIVAA